MLHPDIKKYESTIEGSGLVACKSIKKGIVICRKGKSDYQELTIEELRNIPDRHLPYRVGGEIILNTDGSEYMNHSCYPNTWWLDDDTMTAIRDIHPGEEISYDYGTSEAHLWWHAKWECKCASDICRKVITGRDCLDPAFQERYRGHLPSWTVKFIIKNRGIRGFFFSQLYIFIRMSYWLLTKIRSIL